MPGSHAQGNVDHRLKEIIRILLARFANDKYFCALRSRKAQDMGLTEARIDAGCYEYESDGRDEDRCRGLDGHVVPSNYPAMTPYMKSAG
ncbi:MAG: hypothetical protein WBF50_01765, partial [Pseudolabrys sp.]